MGDSRDTPPTAAVDAQLAHAILESGYVRRRGEPNPPAGEAHQVWFRTAAAYEVASAQWRRAMGVNTHERLAILHLWAHGPQSTGELGQRLGLSRAAMTALVDRLVAAGYVKRESDRRDRRRTILRMTELAFTQGEAPLRPFQEALVRYAESRPPEAWQAVVEFLDAVHDAALDNARALSALDDEAIRRLPAQEPDAHA